MRLFLIFSACFTLSSCAYVADKDIQELTIRTPGAVNAECHAYIGGAKYVYLPPETRTVSKSDDDLIIDCRAPGNRHKKVVIAPTIGRSTLMNASTGVGLAPGFIWDYTSRSIYNFPEAVDVDFTRVQSKPQPLPAQNAPDIRQPEDYDLEEFSPGRMRLNEDRYAPKVEIKKRQPPEDFDLYGYGYDDGAGEFEGDLGENTSGDPVSRVIGNLRQGGIEVPSPQQNTESSSQPASEKTTAPAGGNSGSSASDPEPVSLVPDQE